MTYQTWVYLCISAFAISFACYCAFRLFLLKLTDVVNEHRAEAYKLGWNQGWEKSKFVTLHDVLCNPDQPIGYRQNASRLLKVCGECGKTCIHCARAGTSRSDEVKKALSE